VVINWMAPLFLASFKLIIFLSNLAQIQRVSQGISGLFQTWSKHPYSNTGEKPLCSFLSRLNSNFLKRFPTLFFFVLTFWFKTLY
jgi:hypothetical protein